MRERLAGRTSVMLGHSGVGKSTLVNALVPGTDRAIGVVNDVTGRGRHTSTSALMLRLPDGRGWIVDTPGIRSFGLAHVDAGELIRRLPRPRRRSPRLPARLHPRGPSPSAASTWRSPTAPSTPPGWSRTAGCWAAVTGDR